MIIKYLRLESYEDALDSIESSTRRQSNGQMRFARILRRIPTQVPAALGDQRQRNSTQPVAKLTRSIHLPATRTRQWRDGRSVTVDLPETFNYLYWTRERPHKR